jgi:hypothetical protein
MNQIIAGLETYRDKASAGTEVPYTMQLPAAGKRIRNGSFLV